MGAVAQVTKVEAAEVDVPTGNLYPPFHTSAEGVTISFSHGNYDHVESLTVAQAISLIGQLQGTLMRAEVERQYKEFIAKQEVKDEL